MKKYIAYSLTFLCSLVILTACDLKKDDTKGVMDFAIQFGEMVQNKDEQGIRNVYPEAGDVNSAHLTFYRDKIDIFPEEDGQYKIRYGNGAYIIVRKGLNDAMEVVKSEGIFDRPGSASDMNKKNKNSGPVEVAPLHKKSTPSGLPNYDWLSRSYVTHNDLAYKSGSELRIMRNYIYARHGYKFKSPDLQKYFDQYSWYTPRYSDVSSLLNEIEKSNVQTILSYE